jgi:hypothetical protein
MMSLNCGHQRACCSSLRWTWSHGGMILTRENRKNYQKKIIGIFIKKIWIPNHETGLWIQSDVLKKQFISPCNKDRPRTWYVTLITFHLLCKHTPLLTKLNPFGLFHYVCGGYITPPSVPLRSVKWLSQWLLQLCEPFVQRGNLITHVHNKMDSR